MSDTDERPVLVEVAVDVAGVAGGKTFTYHLPESFAEVGPGEVVLVGYGGREAVGMVIGRRAGPPDRPTKPVLARVKADGPLLAETQVRLASWIADHYLAPPAMVIRQFLPPGMLERVELIATAREAAADPAEGSADGPVAELLTVLRAAGPTGIAVAALPRQEGRAAVMRRMRQARTEGLVDLEWRILPPGARPRLARVVRLNDAGRGAARRLAESGADGRPLGPRQRALLEELARLGVDERPAAADLAARHGAGAVTGLARRGLVELGSETLERRPLGGLGATARGATEHGTRPTGSALTGEQQAIVDRVSTLIGERRHGALLVEGATASGKTAVYASAIAAALQAGRGAIVLVPEVALATPLVDRLRHELGVEVALLHSALSDGERADEWRRIRAGEARIVVGTRIAILAPLADVGVIVVDEEHDAAYKSDRTPRFQARDVALELGRIAGAPVILGSATPSIETLGRARLGHFEHLRLTERTVGALVDIAVVDLRAELEAGNRGLLSTALVDALGRLDVTGGERAILVMNRRGSASVVLCRDCGYVQVCPECQRPLVFHAAVMALRCHHCGATAPIAQRCPACGSARIRYLGGGTQRIEQEVRVRLPGLRVGRLDRDVVERKGAAARVIDDLAEGRIDVLVGTSLVTKGLDVPEVVLVGVVSADIALNLPDERAAERTYQLLTQAIGRAGRGSRPGHAIIQTYQPDHPVIRAVADRDAAGFVAGELLAREAFGAPPFGSVIKLTAALEDRAAAEAVARGFAGTLRERATGLATAADGPPAVVLGPVPAYIARRGGRWRFHLILRGRDPAAVLGDDPGAPWSVDVDPESLM